MDNKVREIIDVNLENLNSQEPPAEYADHFIPQSHAAVQSVKPKRNRLLTKPVQDYYPDAFANCFGCGRNNLHGLHTKTWWIDEEKMGYCKFIPKQHYCGYKAVFHGGLISSVIECNSVATSIAATVYEEGLDPDKDVVFYVLGEIVSTKLINPVPIDAIVEVKTKIIKFYPRKAHCYIEVYGNGTLCTTAHTTTVRVSNQFIQRAFLDNQTGEN